MCRLRRGPAETRCRTGRVPGWLGVGHRPVREYEGEIFTDYYFGEANTATKSDNYHNNAINENLNWGGISGLLHLFSSIYHKHGDVVWRLEVRKFGIVFFCSSVESVAPDRSDGPGV